MRRSLIGVLACACSFGLAVAGCRTKPAPPHRADATEPVPSASGSTEPPLSRAAITAVERSLQTTRLTLPPRRRHLPQLAFGAGTLARLRDGDVQVLDDRSLDEVAVIALDRPRAVVGMADGALVAVGDGGLVRFERGKRVAPPGARPVLFPGAELYPDARSPDLLWVFDAESSPPNLRSYRLGASSVGGVLVPEQAIDLQSPRGGTLGVTREGVWLYLTPHRVERLAPSGLQLTPLVGGPASVPSWSLPTRRVDQSVWVDEAGNLTRALVSPVFKPLGAVSNPGSTYAAEAGYEGRLLALITVTGAGPRFELSLFDADLRELARARLPGEPPTGERDWLRVVTRNQELAVAPRSARVAVGGPDRLTIYDESAVATLSIPIR